LTWLISFHFQPVGAFFLTKNKIFFYLNVLQWGLMLFWTPLTVFLYSKTGNILQNKLYYAQQKKKSTCYFIV